MLGCVMYLQLISNALGLGWLKGFVQGGRRMGVEVVHHQHHPLSLGIMHVHQLSCPVSPIQLGAPLGHGGMSPARQRLETEKYVGNSFPHVFVILFGTMSKSKSKSKSKSRHHRQWLPTRHIAEQ